MDGNEKQKLWGRVEESMMQKEKLPAYNDIVHRFSLFSQSPLCSTQIGPGGSLCCSCEGCSQWHAFVEGRCPDCMEVQYEVFTLEHVKGLAHYLLIQAAEYKLHQMNVLEVGAGSGRLALHLKSYLSGPPASSSQGCVVQLTATDSGERGLNGPNVARQDAARAISETLPHVVLVCWMPLGIDWTACIRAAPTVLEYILIGETDNGICGDPWLTWGYSETDNLSASSSEDPTSLDISDGPLGSNSFFSNYGPGRPVDVAEIISARSRSQQVSPLEQSYPPPGLEFEGNVDEMFVGKAESRKKVKLEPASRQESSKWADLVLTKVEDPHVSTGLHTVSNRKRVGGSDLPPYAGDGWVRIELESLSSFQVCRTDERWSTVHHSHTVAFRRCIPSIFQSDNCRDVQAAI